MTRERKEEEARSLLRSPFLPGMQLFFLKFFQEKAKRDQSAKKKGAVGFTA